MDILEHLMEEHRKAESLMQRLADSEEGPERDATLDELEEALRIHMTVEEQYIYPLVNSALDEEKAEEAEVEHALARDGLSNLRELRAAPGFGAAVAMLQGGIGHHVEEEEQEIFPQLREAVGDRLAELDPTELEEKAKSSQTIDLTRDELYEKAKEADIPGRAQMTKDELAEALSAQD